MKERIEESDWFKALEESIRNTLGRIFQDGYNRGYEDRQKMTHTSFSNATRIEVIDHRKGAPQIGRVFCAWNSKITLSYQDGGRTLKIFVDGVAP